MSKKLLKENNIAVIDTETTGLDPQQHEVIELGVIIYDPRKNIILKEWETKIAPRHIETAQEKALEINGYRENPESYTGDMKDAMTHFIGMTQDCMYLGQNVQFDIDFIEKHCNEVGLQSPFHRHNKLEIVSMLWPIILESDLTSLRLRAICDYLGISNDGEHRALVDCRRTLEVYKCIMQRLKT